MPEEPDIQPLESPEGTPPPDPLGIIGWVIGGKYKIQAYVGGGGFGEVYSGCNINLTEQRLIIKFFKRVQAREKFAKEAKILCMLDHPNICRVIDFLPNDGAVVVAFIDGRDGAKVLKESGPLAPDLFMKVALALTDAMAYAHEKKIAHRDIKPGNLIIDKNEHIYLIDFGIAKEIGGDATKTGYQTLTPMFAAPERQAGDRDYNPFISDVYETGITLFNFITGSLPYRNPINPNYAEWGGTAAAKLSPDLRRILMKATHPDPRKRYQTMAELSDEFKNLKQVYGGHRRRSSVVYVLATVVVIAAAIAAWQFLKEPAQTAQTPQAPVETQKPETAKPKPSVESGTTKPQTTTTTVPPRTDTTKINAVVKPYPPATQPSGQQAKPETQTQTETKPVEQPPAKEVPPPVAPAPATARIDVTPGENAYVMVDGTSVTAGKSFETKVGTHAVIVTHPDFPVYRSSSQFHGGDGNAVAVDLGRVYASTGKVEFQVALSPPTDKYMLELSFNGRKKTMTKFPAFGTQQLAGEWDVTAKVVPVDRTTAVVTRVDSCVAYPYGDGPRAVLRGDRGMIKL
ncbi:MAG: serine/threonine-protein kinase, partial [candidate division Zixibacteria bacterium]|nr:serine/threonine-protein kinase [candidate division Zixibacteria bacterium]